MRDRLIELLKVADKRCGDTKQCENCVGFGHGSECVNYLIADHLLAEGVIVPPCKVGDELYLLSTSRTQVKTYIVTHLEIYGSGIKIYGKLNGCGAEYWLCWHSDLGTDGWEFLIREEAEKALERSKGE